MNVSELARQLRVHPKKLLEILPEFGFDVGARAVKIDDRVAQQIQQRWRRMKMTLEERERQAQEDEKKKEKELRKASGASVAIPSVITVKDLAARLNTPVTKLIVDLMKNGILANQNENLDRDTASIVASDFGFQVVDEHKETVAADESHVAQLEETLAKDVDGAARAPVVVIMGHVDHGKTTLLDAIRSANVVASEAGGITQHMGAYQVNWTDPKSKVKRDITFIDTPGHEAFTVMRSRGAKVADIAVLVVAADDGVKPQTVEAINIIKAAKLPVVVALNKIDKEGADPERVRSGLSQHGIVPEDWGGDAPVVEISAKKNLHIDKLLDTLLLVADVHGDVIRASADRAAAGTVIESRVHKGEGAIATVLVQTGTLRVNDPLVVNGEIYGKVRAMKNYRGENIDEAGPSCPVRILGFKVAPRVGDVLDVERALDAKTVDIKAKRAEQSGAEQHMTAAQAQAEDNNGEGKKFLNVIIKADTLGSLEAIIGTLDKMRTDEVAVKVVGKGLGNITADDVSLAETTSAMVFAFHVAATPIAHNMIQSKNIRFFEYKIIYDLFNFVRDELEKLLNPEELVIEIGVAKVLAIFRAEKKVVIVGARVEKGKLENDCEVRVKQDGNMVGKGKITKLQMNKQAVREIQAGSECGIQIEGKLTIEEGDVLEVFRRESKIKKLTFGV